MLQPGLWGFSKQLRVFLCGAYRWYCSCTVGKAPRETSCSGSPCIARSGPRRCCLCSSHSAPLCRCFGTAPRRTRTRPPSRRSRTLQAPTRRQDGERARGQVRRDARNVEGAAAGDGRSKRGNKIKGEQTEIDRGERQREGICVRDYVFWDWIII